MPIIAETERLRIRTWELQDIATLCSLTEQEGLSEYSISGYANYTEERAAAWIQKEKLRFEKNKLGKFLVLSKELNKPLGIAGIFQSPPPHESQIEINYRFPIEFRGRGFATEAAQAILNYGFNSLGLTQIFAKADLRNIPSQKVLARLGMKQIGETTYHGVLAGIWRKSRGD